MTKNLIDTSDVSAHYRELSINLERKLLRITNFTGTEQEKDFTEHSNCGGFGRIRHFVRKTSPGWPENPLPIDPALNCLRLPRAEILRAQVFQSASCNWRCWFCFVPFDLLAANPKKSSWLSPSELVQMYLDQPNPPKVIDLTGGQPDLVPEWVPWMMRELIARNLHHDIYLWSDDNLSTDYFWRYLSESDRELVASYKNYGKVCCFKGFDEESFSFNTLARPELFKEQFKLFGRLLDLGIDLYAYAIFTSEADENIGPKMSRFVDMLQAIHPNLPLRTVPLEVRVYTPVSSRMTEEDSRALENQNVAIRAWTSEMGNRFSARSLSLPIIDVPMRRDGP